MHSIAVVAIVKIPKAEKAALLATTAVTAVGLLGLGALLCVSARRGAVSLTESADSEAPGGSAALTAADIGNWCADELERVAGGGCFAAPQGVTSAPLVVYVHDTFSRENARQEIARQSLVAQAALSQGFAVLALLGERGECKNGLLTSSFCWPTSGRTESDGPRFVTRWQPSMDEAERRIGTSGARYLLGVGNGADFAVLVATHALARFDAIALAGAQAAEPIRAVGAKPPALVLTEDGAAPDPQAVKLDIDLTQATWPHALVAREGAHRLLASDVDTALTFFKRTHDEGWPLSPPMDKRWTPPAPRVSIAPSPPPPAEQPVPTPAPNPIPPQAPPPAAVIVPPPVETTTAPAPPPAPGASAEAAHPDAAHPENAPHPENMPLEGAAPLPPSTDTLPPPAPPPSVPPPLPPGVSSSPPAGVPTD
jgi:hypothetical protein